MLLACLKESLQTIVPVSLLVLLFHFTLAPMPSGMLALFVTGTAFLVAGNTVFSLGAEMAVMPMGEIVGSKLVRSRKLWLLAAGSFAVGAAVTVAEPDLQVLAKQVPSVPDMALVAAVACGVGLFLMIALLRILFRVRMAPVLIVSYGIVFLVAFAANPDYLPVAFDSGGVTTGPVTVPFILALGMGVSAMAAGRNREEDSFGLCGVSSIGPVISVLILGLFFDPDNIGHAFEPPRTADGAAALVALFGSGFLRFLQEIALAMAPIVAIFLLSQCFRPRLAARQFLKLSVGIVYSLLGLAVFLTGANIGFMPAGNHLGEMIASRHSEWVLLAVSVLIGCFVVAVEPAVQVLNKQVEDMTNGAIPRKMMMTVLSAAVGLAMLLAMFRILHGIGLWVFLLPGYAAALALTLAVPGLFASIAFDSGGVAAGTMAAAFLTPSAVGVSNARGGHLMTDAFGIVAMVAMMPLITVQLAGLVYGIKLRRMKKAAMDAGGPAAEDDTNVIEF